MTLVEIIAQARVDLDDLVVPYLWSDADLCSGANYAVDTLAESAFLIYDDQTPSICGPTVVLANQPYLTKDPRIIEVRELRLTPISITLNDLTFSASGRTIITIAGDFVAAGFVANSTIQITGSAYNNTQFTVSSLTAKVLTIQSAPKDESDSNSITILDFTTGPYLYPMVKRSREWLEHHFPTWPSALPGQPQIYCENMRIGALRLIPVPEINLVATMMAYRYPLVKMSLDNIDALPEFEERFHKFIRYGVLSKAYLKADNEAYDAKKAMEYRELFLGSNDGKIQGDVQKAYRLKYSVELQVSETVGVNKAFAG